MSTTHTEMLERQDLIQKLIDHGHGRLVDTLLSNERVAYTRKGRLNKSATCRLLGWRSIQLERALAECRLILCPDLGDERATQGHSDPARGRAARL